MASSNEQGNHKNIDFVSSLEDLNFSRNSNENLQRNATKYKALFDFQARTEDELSFLLGDTLESQSGGTCTSDPGWVNVRSKTTGMVGLAPLNYLSILINPEMPSGFQPNSPTVRTNDVVKSPFLQQVDENSFQSTISSTSPSHIVDGTPNTRIVEPSRSEDLIEGLDLLGLETANEKIPPSMNLTPVGTSGISSQLDQFFTRSPMESTHSPMRPNTKPRPATAYPPESPPSVLSSKPPPGVLSPEPILLSSGKKSGYATDIVAVVSKANDVYMTQLNVKFSTKANPYALSACGDTVHVFVNGTYIPELDCVIDSAGACRFALPVSQRGNSLLRVYKTGTEEYPVVFQHRPLDGSPLRHVEANLWMLPYTDSFMVSDVDGTITKSDIGGLWNTAFRLKAGLSHTGYAHKGTCYLFNHIVQETGCRVLYLTARPMRLMNETREYLTSLEQFGLGLPPGPVVSDTTGYLGSIRREIFDKSSHEFKTNFLLELQRCFEFAGRRVDQFPLFLACFGNKDTDAQAYLAAGARPETTFLINSKSELRTVGYHPSQGDLRCYDDPKVISWLEQLMKLLRDGQLPPPP